MWSFKIIKREFVIMGSLSFISSLLCARLYAFPLVQRCLYLRERSFVLPVLSCNFSVKIPLWKVLCGYSENPSVWKRGRKAVARTSKHILVFMFDFLSLNSLFFISYNVIIIHIHIHARYYLCARTCVQQRELLTHLNS